MQTRSQRRQRRERRHRIAGVAGVCAIALGLAFVLASCSSGGTTASASADRSLLRARTVRDAHPAPDPRVVPTTTTTTRPAVNPDTGPPPPGTGAGRRIVYCNSCQKVWLVDDTDFVVAMFSVSGRRGTPRPGVYHVHRKLEMGRSKAHPDLRLPYFVGFAWGATTDIGFHGIPLRLDGSQIESDAQLGQPLSSGCVRESRVMARIVFDWTAVGTTVVVTA